jgi:hypothetical protein
MCKSSKAFKRLLRYFGVLRNLLEQFLSLEEGVQEIQQLTWQYALMLLGPVEFAY